jgi:hypothetical protein
VGLSNRGFETKQRLGADRRPQIQSTTLLLNRREAPMVAYERQISVGSIFSSPLVLMASFISSFDGFLYALNEQTRIPAVIEA